MNSHRPGKALEGHSCPMNGGAWPREKEESALRVNILMTEGNNPKEMTFRLSQRLSLIEK